MNSHCSNLLDLRNNLQEQVKKAFCYQKLFRHFTVQTNCSSANSRPSDWNFKSFSRSLQLFFSHSRSNNFGNKIPVLVRSLVSSIKPKFDNSFFVLIYKFCTSCGTGIVLPVLQELFCKSKQTQFHVHNLYKTYKSTNNWSSKFGLIKETLDPSRILWNISRPFLIASWLDRKIMFVLVFKSCLVRGK